MRGRKPIPFPLKETRGTARNDRKPKNMPEPPTEKPSRPPSWLKDKQARKAWSEFSAWLSSAGVLSKLDRVALEMLSVTYGKWRQASEKAEVGLYKTGTGYVAHNPMISVENRYAKILQGLLVEFGMTPSSRSRLALPDPDQREGSDPMEELLNAK